jgi:sialic acid synthase SpsE/sugar phosphate isomerase/epimerase
MRNMDSLYGSLAKENKAKADLGTQYTLDLLSKYQLSNAEIFEVLDYCKKKGVLGFCTPWDEFSLKALEEHGSPFYKVASADLTNHPLLKLMVATGKPLICSTGMATDEEIRQASELLGKCAGGFALLHCNSTYPAPFKDINLRYMKTLEVHTSVVGYSGHERGIHIPIAAVAMGAAIIEKHFTIDKKMEGVDHKVSLLPMELKLMVEEIRELEMALGQEIPGPRRLSQGEMMNRENLGKSIVAVRSLAKGDIITSDDLTTRSPGQGLPPYYIPALLGCKTKREIDAGDIFMKSDLEDLGSESRPRIYHFNRPWGLPVRYHDTRVFLNRVKPDFLEFHLSYGDMSEDPAKFLDGPYEHLGFTVHAPELFASDHLLDLCSPDPAYLRKSIDNMKRVVEVTLELKRFFPRTVKPFIIATVGGFTEHRPLSLEERVPLYERILESLRLVEHPDVEILPQTAAPFPWHMGGQQYQNLFVFPDEIHEFCRKSGYRMCLDVSHSYLACHHHKIDREYFFKTVGPHTAHIHFGDSAGVDGEGLQIGDGEVDFTMLGRVFQETCPNAWFIPEVWQGHKNQGEGFWIGLSRLERFL